MTADRWYLVDLPGRPLFGALSWGPDRAVARALRARALSRQQAVLDSLRPPLVTAGRRGLVALRDAVFVRSGAPPAVLADELARRGVAAAVRPLGGGGAPAYRVLGAGGVVDRLSRHLGRPEGAVARPPVVGVLDSGVDYTHRWFGGPGTSAAYARAYGLSFAEAAAVRRQALAGRIPADLDVPASTRTADGSGSYFPTPTVTAGHDFVGERWTGEPGGPGERPDPNPIDIHGHGTTTAGIVLALCPQARLVAVKVAASFAPACSVPAVLQGLEFCLDPGRTGELAPVDVVNLSFGVPTSSAGEDVFAEAAAQLAELGVVCVAAGGEDSTAASPAASPASIGVGESPFPGDAAAVLRVGGRSVPASPQWFGRPLERRLSGALAPAAAADVTGRVVLVAAGEGPLADAAAAAGRRGALAVLAVSGQSQVDNESRVAVPVPVLVLPIGVGPVLHRAAEARVTVTVDPAAEIPTGPAPGWAGYGGAAKPDLVAPGGCAGPEAATGTATARRGGSSAATAVVTAAAAALRARRPELTPAEVRSLLAASSARPAGAPGHPGEVRPAAAARLRVAVSSGSGHGRVTLPRDRPAYGRLLVRNVSTERLTVRVTVDGPEDPPDISPDRFELLPGARQTCRVSLAGPPARPDPAVPGWIARVHDGRAEAAIPLMLSDHAEET